MTRANAIMFQKKARDWAMIAETLLTSDYLAGQIDHEAVKSAQMKASYYSAWARRTLFKLLAEGE